jgi:hypothetical protein
MNAPLIPQLDKRTLAFYGALGAVAPDIMILYSKRWTMPSLTFEPSQYAIATALYIFLAAIVATIYPYRNRASTWKAFVVGVGLPTIMSGAMSLQGLIALSPRGQSIPGTVWDLVTLF